MNSPRKSVLGEGTSSMALNWNTPGRFQEQELSERTRPATGTEGHRETRIPTSALGAHFCCHEEYEAGLGDLKRENGGRKKNRSLGLRSRVSPRARVTELGAVVHLASSVKRNPSRRLDGKDVGRGSQGKATCLLGERAGHWAGRAYH